MASITIKTLPISTNNIYAHIGRRRFMTPRAKANKESIAWEARSQYRGAPLTGSLSVKIDLYWGDKRKHDIDNIKILLDSLTGIVWEDDSQIDVLHISKHYDKQNPRVELSTESP